MAWANDLWGLTGWLVAVAIPVCMWAFFALLVVLLLRRSPAGASAAVAAPDLRTADSRTDAGGFGWLPPVPSHH
ncbi:MAG: hypothetical protein JWP02_3973 [Acidimicrobiales bacterium]|nr:hypothetical protein [Acidimicrobiales bacterium]